VLTGAGVGIITTDDTDAFTGSASTGITINNAGHTGAIDPTPIVQPFQTCNVLIKK
jgi:hypothetical protein